MLQSGLQVKGGKVLLDDAIWMSSSETSHITSADRIWSSTLKPGMSPPKAYQEGSRTYIPSSKIMSHAVPSTCHHNSLFLTMLKDNQSRLQFTLLKIVATGDFSMTPQAVEKPWQMFAATKQSHVASNPSAEDQFILEKSHADFRRCTEVPVTVFKI